LLALAVVTVVAALLAVGIGGPAYYRRHLDRVQRTEYARGHAAYTRADCVRALPHLARSLEHPTDRRLQALALQEQDACQRFVAVRAEAATLDPPEALVVYLDQVFLLPDHVLAPVLRDDMVRLVRESGYRELAGQQVCDRDAEIRSALGGGTAGAAGSRWWPRFQLACAALRERSGPRFLALETYLQVRRDHRSTGYERLALRGLVRLTAAARQEADQVLRDRPVLLGFDHSLDSRSVLVVANSTADPVVVTLSGSRTVRRTLAGCPSCARKRADGVGGCHADAPVTMITVPAGWYRIRTEPGGGGPEETLLFDNAVNGRCLTAAGSR
jgi:hypothetical protein